MSISIAQISAYGVWILLCHSPVLVWIFCCCCTGELAKTKFIFGFLFGVSTIFTVGSLRFNTCVTFALAGLSFRNSLTWEYVLLLKIKSIDKQSPVAINFGSINLPN